MNNKLEKVLTQSSSENQNKTINEIVKKITKIELLNKNIKVLEEKIAQIREKADAQTKEKNIQFQKAKENYITLLMDKYTLKGLNSWQKNIIEDIISDEMMLLNKMELISEELNSKYAEFNRLLIEKLGSYEKELAKDTMKNMFSEMGIDLDNMPDFDVENIHNIEFIKEMKQKIQEEHYGQQEKEKEQEKEQKVINTNIDFQKLYKKLVKLVHPDLHKTEKEREIKETQIKKLTVAWDNRDYYEILMLWLEIDPENTSELDINEKNKKAIIKQLNEKIFHLEQQQYYIKNEKPDTWFYYTNFNAPNEKLVDKKIKKYADMLTINITETLEISEKIKKTTVLKQYLTELYNIQQNNYYNFDSFM